MRATSLFAVSLLALAACRAADPPSEPDDAGSVDAASGADAGAGLTDTSSADDAPATPGEDAFAASDAPSSALCPPTGPFGQRPGAVAQDLVLLDCDGVEHSLHELCERDAVWLFELAAWCPPCRTFAMSEANRIYDRFESEAGDRFAGWVVVSENATFDPATRMDCEEIRTRYGLHAPVLFDPEGRLQDAFGVPSNEVQIVLGEGAVIRHVDQYAADEVEARIAAVLAE